MKNKTKHLNNTPPPPLQKKTSCHDVQLMTSPDPGPETELAITFAKSSVEAREHGNKGGG